MTTGALAAARRIPSSGATEKDGARSVFVTNGLLGLAFASFLSYRGLRKGSLSRSGAMAAWVVGFLTMLASLRFGAVLILFYQSSSTLTKFRAEVKARSEEDHAHASCSPGRGAGKGEKGGSSDNNSNNSNNSKKKGGDHHHPQQARSAAQVLACSVLGTALAAAHAWVLGPDDRPVDFAADPLRSRLLCAFVGHYACCNGDTWASEVGILSPSSPRLVTSLLFRQRVPRGTNGGVSWTGTLASVAGGAFIGAGHTLAGRLLLGVPDDVVVVAGAGAGAGAGGVISWLPGWAHMAVLGAVCGCLGSLLDSVLGALLQPTWFCRERKRVVKHPTPREVREGAVALVSGRQVLTNEQVNALSVLATTAVAPLIGQALFGGGGRGSSS